MAAAIRKSQETLRRRDGNILGVTRLMLFVFNLTFGGVFPLDRTSSDCALLICWEKKWDKTVFRIEYSR